MRAENDAIAAVATPPGKGGIGVVRISGGDLTAIIGGILADKIPPPRKAVRAKFYDENGQAIDDGIALYFPSPHSFTGQEILELHAHGGPAILRILLRRCCNLGARLANPGEFTLRAFLNGKIDLAQAEGVADLINAATDESARAAARTLAGDLSAAADKINRQLSSLRALTEAGLDFSDEEIDFADGGEIAQKIREIESAAEKFRDSVKQGILLRDGFCVAIVGSPNAGKSSLLNFLVGDDAAIVTAEAGTTRDLIRRTISLCGVPLHLIDTAGIHSRQLSEAEKIGIARAKSAAANADLILHVEDLTRPPTPLDLPTEIPSLRIKNKIDLANLPPSVADGVVFLSAKTGDGVELLKKELMNRAGLNSGDAPFAARERHLRAMESALAYLSDARHRAAELEICAESLRLAHEAIGEIVGGMTPDELLGEIFSRFCIGK